MNAKELLSNLGQVSFRLQVNGTSSTSAMDAEGNVLISSSTQNLDVQGTLEELIANDAKGLKELSAQLGFPDVERFNPDDLKKIAKVDFSIQGTYYCALAWRGRTLRYELTNWSFSGTPEEYLLSSLLQLWDRIELL